MEKKSLFLIVIKSKINYLVFSKRKKMTCGRTNRKIYDNFIESIIKFQYFILAMEINPIQMNDEYDNKGLIKKNSHFSFCSFEFFFLLYYIENTVLRNLEGDPNRHTSVVDQRPPSTIFAQQQPPSMYTLETRYQPIPAKVSPTKNEPRVYYIGAQRDEEPAIINESMSLVNFFDSKNIFF